MGFTPEQPAYSGSGVSVWNAVTKDGKPYLKVKILGYVTNCFLVEEKKKA